jgi:hypothetical protein
MYVFWHIFTKEQPVNIKYISYHAACNGRNTPLMKNLGGTVLKGSAAQKLPSPNREITAPDEPIPSLGKELTHKQWKNASCVTPPLLQI